MAIFLIKVQPVVKTETKRIAVGSVFLSALMLIVFGILGKFDLTVLLGAALGTFAAVGNFFLLALSVQKAAEKMNGSPLPSYEEAETQKENANDELTADTPEIRQAKRQMRASYSGRLMLLALVGILGLALPCFHAVATVIPFLFPRIVIFIYGVTNK